jgi:class 3 adenylate cyclase/tetratricopeptide (TPR) repeat protein
MDPLNESQHRRLIALYARNGEPNAALLQFEALRRLLSTELGLSPEKETQDLLTHIRSRPSERIEKEIAPIQDFPAFRLERRPATVLAVDIFSERGPSQEDQDAFDPDHEQGLTQAMELAKRLGALVSPAQGSSFLAYFGLRDKSEGAARKAARAALEIRTLLSRVGHRREGGVLVRGGIHAGMVVIGGESDPPDRTGTISRPAMSLCMQAEPGTFVVSSSTFPLLKDQFLLEKAGTFRVLGAQWEGSRLLGPLDAHSRKAKKDLPLIGRGSEVALFQKLWEKRKGRILLVEGDPGIGKSRLIRECIAIVQKEGGGLRMIECLPQYQDSALWPVIRILREFADLPEEITDIEAYSRITTYLEFFPLEDRRTAVALLGHLFSLSPHPEYPLPEVPAALLKEMSTDLILVLLRARVAKKRILVVAEDLHWADESTQHVLKKLLVDPLISPATLFLFSFRRGEGPLWIDGLAQSTRLPLCPLSPEESQSMIRSFCQSASLPGMVVGRLATASGGIPLFLEELTRSALESDGQRQQAQDVAIPKTLQEVLIDRLLRLGKALPPIQAASAVGRRVPIPLLKFLLPEFEPVLGGCLEQAEKSGFITLKTDSGGDFFEFNHALIQEAAYRSLIASDRETIHRRIADTLLGHFPLTAQNTPEVVARHFEQASDPGPAIEWYEKAARMALSRASLAEAEHHVRAALRLLPRWKEAPNDPAIEIRLLTLLGNAMLELYGYGSQEVRSVYQRALDLCQGQDPLPTEVFKALYGLFVTSLGEGNLHEAKRISQALRKGADHAHPSFLPYSLYADGNVFLWQGHFDLSVSHLTLCCNKCRDPWEDWVLDVPPEDILRRAASYRSWSLWFSGKFSEAQHELDWMMAQARALDHPVKQGLLLTFACILLYFFRLPERLLKVVEELEVSVRNNKTEAWSPATRTFRGWALSCAGDPDGLSMIFKGLPLVRSAHRIAEILYLSPLAETYLLLGDIRRSSGVVDAALRLSGRSGIHLYDAELWRIKGAGDLFSGDTAQAEACFRKSLEIARLQKARALELRAATDLGRLFQRTGSYERVGPLFTPFEDLLVGLKADPTLPDIREALQICSGSL